MTKTRYLKQYPDGFTFLWTEELAKRQDMVEVDNPDAALPPDPRLVDALGLAGLQDEDEDEIPRVTVDDADPADTGPGDEAPADAALEIDASGEDF